MSVVIIMVTVPTLVSTWQVLIAVNVLLGTLSYLINTTVPEEVGNLFCIQLQIMSRVITFITTAIEMRII